MWKSVQRGECDVINKPRRKQYEMRKQPFDKMKIVQRMKKIEKEKKNIKAEKRYM